VRSAGLLALALSLACGRSAEPSGRPIDPDAGITISPEVVFATTSEGTFPARTLTDWVSYAVQVSEVTVLSERELRPPPAVWERGEGYIGRQARLRIDRTLWKSPGALTPGAMPDPAEVNVVVAGWVLRARVRHRMAFKDSPRLEVGGRYIIPLQTMSRPKVEADGSVSSTEQEAQWGPLALDCQLAIAGDPVATADAQLTGIGPLARMLSMLSTDDLASRLASTPPGRFVDKYWHLEPRERLRAVQQDQNAAAADAGP
jgi:hypothetical protein